MTFFRPSNDLAMVSIKFLILSVVSLSFRITSSVFPGFRDEFKLQLGSFAILFSLNPMWEESDIDLNYQVKFFGLLNSAAVEHSNLGASNQRIVLEWVAENGEAFGDDAKALALLGQSAGAKSVDQQLVSFWDSLITRALGIESGTALLSPKRTGSEHTNLNYMVELMGCDFPSDPIEELECMQHVPYHQLANLINTRPWTEQMVLGPIENEGVCFSNYTTAALSSCHAC